MSSKSSLKSFRLSTINWTTIYFLFLTPIPRYPNVGGPQVIEANEDEEEDPEEVLGVFDVDSDHFDE